MKDKPRRNREFSPQAQKKLASSQFNKWLDVKVLNFDDGNLTRRDIVELTKTPCVAAAMKLQRVCRHFNITTLDKLYATGHDALARCEGIGERTCLIAAYAMAIYGYNVDHWLAQTPGRILQWPDAIAARHRRPAVAQHRKHA